MKVDIKKNQNKSIYRERNFAGMSENNKKENLTNNSSKKLDTLVIIDSHVQDYQQLLKGIRQGIEAVILSPNLDPVTQITTILAQKPKITTLHLVSHGSPGCLYLGNSKLSLSTLDNYQQYLKKWQVKQILVYGCNVAATEAGKEFLTKLHQLTGAAITASTKPTGNALLGGNWQLEFTVKEIQTSLLPQFPEGVFHWQVLREYQGVLAATLVGEWQRLTSVSDLAVQGNYAYAVGDGLEVIDISNPNNQIFKTFSNIISDASEITIVGNTAYVADRNAGLKIINLSNPAVPTLLGTYDTPESALDVAVVGNIAYLADGTSVTGGNGGLQIIDISNPTVPTLLETYDTPESALDVAVVGNTAYITAGNAGLQIIDVSNPTGPTLLGTYDSKVLYYDVTVADNIAYLAAGGAGLEIIDVSNPAQPVYLSTVSGLTGLNDVTVIGNTAYATDYYGYRIIDISNPAQPSLSWFYESRGSGNVTVEGNTAYFSKGGITTFNISNPTEPTLLGTYSLASASNLTVVGNTAYLAARGAGLQIIDISNRAMPTLLGSYDTPGNARYVTVVGNTAYLADGEAGLQILDISNPTGPTVLGTYDTPYYAIDVAVVGNTAYVADLNAGLQIIDVSNSSQPRLLGNYNAPGGYGQNVSYTNIDNVEVVGNTAYVINGAGLQIIDVSNPAEPTLLGTYGTPYGTPGATFDLAPHDLTVVNNTAYLTNPAELQIIDVSNPALPTRLGTYDLDYANDVSVVDNTAYVTGRTGIQILNVSNPAGPTVLATYDSSSSANDITVAGNYAYLASDGGLEIIDVSDLTSLPPTNPNNPDSLLSSPVYRFYNPFSKGHFFTTNSVERDNILARPELGYTFEGTGFYAATTEGDNLLPVYRFYNPLSRGHFFTTNTAERDNILARPQLGYQFEGTGFYAYGADANLGNDIFRFYNSSSAGHFFTANPVERDNVIAHREWGYTFEGVGFEAA